MEARFSADARGWCCLTQLPAEWRGLRDAELSEKSGVWPNLPSVRNCTTKLIRPAATSTCVSSGLLPPPTGIPGCVFVHAAGFIGGNATLEGAMAMAAKAVEL